MSRFRPVVSRRVPASSHFAELFLAPGPQAIGETGDNSYQALYGRSWLLVWDRDDGLLHLFQEQLDATWLEVTADLPPVFASLAPSGSRRWSLAFDQSARVILAYEGADGIVRVTRWDPATSQYVQNVSFNGVDPVTVIDATWAITIPYSDVLLFYLSTDREKLLCRVQRDIYATPYEVWDFGSAVILDRVLALPFRYQVLVSDSLGAPLPDMLISDYYPIRQSMFVVGDAWILGGEYRTVVTEYAHDLAVVGDAWILGGEYAEALTLLVHTITVEGDAAIHGGLYEPVVTTLTHALVVAGDAAVERGEYAGIGIQIAHTITVEGDAEIIGGTYATP